MLLKWGMRASGVLNSASRRTPCFPIYLVRRKISREVVAETATTARGTRALPFGLTLSPALSV